MIQSGQTILVTGRDGFVGGHLCPRLERAGYRILSPRIDLPNELSGLDEVRNEDVSVVIHLAGISAVPQCEENPALAYSVNGIGTYLLAKKVADLWPKARLIFTSTAQVYSPLASLHDGSVQFTEETAVFPQNIYADSKWMAETLVREAGSRLSLEVTVLRLFNHTHKSQRPDFFLPVVYQQILQAQKKTSGHPTVEVGNLDVERDIGSIFDLVNAIILVVTCQRTDRKQFEIFNICSGYPKNLRQVAHRLAQKMGVDVEFVVDPQRLRGQEIKSVCGSYEKFAKMYGWQPKARTIDELLSSFFE